MVGRVYKLVDPRNSLPIYVGSTKRILSERLKEHIYSRNKYGTMLSDYLTHNEIRPLIELLEEVSVENSIQLREKEEEWTEKLSGEGVKLMNKNRLLKYSGSIKVNWMLYEEVQDFCNIQGMSIGRFYDQAAEERLRKMKKIFEEAAKNDNL